MLVDIITESWSLFIRMAPYLLLGFVIAGGLSVGITARWVERHLGGNGFGSVAKASLFGVPLPLCSCGVIPVSASLHRHGASRAATTSFLISTPQTGVDSILITYSLLGPVFAIFRPILSLISGVLGGGLVALFTRSDHAEDDGVPTNNNVCTEACCADEGNSSVIMRALRYGLSTLPADIGWALLVGVVIAGAMSALVPTNQLHTYIGGGILSILIMMAAGVPVYVCATASVPIAAGFLHMGASYGAVLAFLIAGPATNAATLTTVWKVLGRRTAVAYLATIIISAIGFGLLLDQIVSFVRSTVPQLVGPDLAHVSSGWMYQVAGTTLLLVLARSLWIKYRPAESNGSAEQAIKTANVDTKQRLEFVVSGMTCSHCVESATRALNECSGVDNVEVDLHSGHVTVAGDQLNYGELSNAIEDLGYTVKA